MKAIQAANDPSGADNLSYIEHIFEISRRPDLLTRVVEYRTTVLKISEDDEIDTKLTRIPSAKKYKGRAGGRRVRSSDLQPLLTLPPGFPAAGLRSQVSSTGVQVSGGNFSLNGA